MKYQLTYALITMTIVGNAAFAATVGDPNLFSLKTVAATSLYAGSPFALPHATDGTPATFVFSDGSAPNRVSISGFDSAIGMLRFFDTRYEQRAAPSVKVYHSTVDQTSVNPADYTLLGTYNLPTHGATSGFDLYNTTTSPPDPWDAVNTGPMNYDTVTGLSIPANTRSVLFEFPSVTGANFGPALSEIQAFAPGVNVVASPLFASIPAVSTTDLINQGTSTLESQSPLPVAGGEFGTFIGGANDGANGANTGDLTNTVIAPPGSIIDYVLNTSVNTLGYDLTSIVSTAAWSESSRLQQSYSVLYSTVNDPGTFLPLATALTQVPENPGAQQVTIFDSSGILATHVKALRFVLNANADGGNDTVFQELDVFGVASVPEPSSLLLCGLAIPLLLRARRK